MEQHNPFMQTLWLLMSVFLFYQQTIDMVSGLKKAKKKHGNIADPFKTKCSEFEEFDGFECVCTSRASERCKSVGGVVCDNTGAVYSTPCTFAVNMCQKKIPVDRKIISCGACEKLKLTGGMKYPEGEVHAIFIRQGADMKLKTKYKSTDGNGLNVFYSSELSAWAIGKITANETYVSLVQEINSTYPQDNTWGMFIAKNKDHKLSWEADSTLHLECMQDETDVMMRKKRFFFLVAFIVASIVVTAAVTTLKVVQAARGCLYYPSVCHLRDEIKKLQPQVKRLHDKFLTQFGNPENISAVVDIINYQISDIRDKIITIEQLHTDLNGVLSSVILDHGSLSEDIPDLKSLLKEQKNMVDSRWKSVLYQDTVNLVSEVILSVISIAAMETVTSFATAAAGIELVLAVGLGIVEVVLNVQEERSVRDKLQKNKSTILQSKKDLHLAFKNMEKFQKLFCKIIITFLRNLSLKGKDFDRTFSTLHGFILATYGEFERDCQFLSIYSKSNRITLNTLNTQYVQPLHQFMSTDIDVIQKRLNELVATRSFLKELDTRIITKIASPKNLFDFLKSHKPIMANKKFVSLFDLLKYISRLLPKNTCYWGTNLGLIRDNKITKKNYLKSPICDCPEIKIFTAQIKIGVKTNIAPCKLANQVQSSVFNCKYKVIKFIADVILSNESCYWGYDLKSLRNQHNPLEINNAVVDSHLLLSLRYFQHLNFDNSNVIITRGLLCSKHNICSHEWQNFLMCHIWKTPDVQINCSKIDILTSGPQCVPDDKHFQSCDKY